MLGGCAPADAQAGGGIEAGPPASAAFQATVYETSLPAARAGQIDTQALAAKAATPEELQKTLAAFGPTKVLYQVYETIALESDSQITIGSRQPFVTNARMAESGRQVNTIQYEQVGAVFKFAGKPKKGTVGGVLDIQLNAELSTMASSGTEIASGHKAVAIRNVRMNYTGHALLDRPFVVLSVDGGGTDANSVAYVCRVLISGPAK